MEFSESLKVEHCLIRRALEILEAMTERVERGIAAEKHDVNALLIFLHYFGDACHQAKEEAILFQSLKRSKDYVPSPELEALLEEHSYEREIVEQTQIALFSDSRNEFIANARKLIRVLSGHSMKEEQVIF